jgi:glycosyltransferase involved in cell wall biosynthesis
LLRKSLRKKQANHEYVIQATVNSPLDKRQRGRYRKTISGEGFYLAPVKSASLFDYNGHVFNFEVEYNNSYCANGFAVHNCEAGACGLPVIATRYSGQTDFLDDKNSWLIDVDGFRSAERELAWISYFYENAEFPILGPKAVEQLRHCMREAFEKKELAKTKANRLHKRVVKEYGWDAAIQQMHDKLKATFDQLAK